MSTEKLRESLDQAEWSWIKPHLARNAVILVTQSLDLLEVGEEVAKDRAQIVEKWINEGSLSKPTAVQIQTWDLNLHGKFLCLVVSPYVLIQQLPNQLQ